MVPDIGVAELETGHVQTIAIDAAIWRRAEEIFCQAAQKVRSVSWIGQKFVQLDQH